MRESELLRRIAGGLSDAEFAKVLGVEHKAISRVRHGQFTISGALYLALLREYPVFTKQILACLLQEEVSG